MGATPSPDIADLLTQYRRLPPGARSAFHRFLDDDDPDRHRKKFLPFVRKLWPAFIHGRHHDLMSEAFEEIVQAKLNRVVINVPPRHTKSKFASAYFPAWYLGCYPDRKILLASHNASLAQEFGRELRNLIATEEYQDVFPGVKLSADSRAAGCWSTAQGCSSSPSEPRAARRGAAAIW
jgi:hypothetical protein